ncbi:MAG: 5'-deoxynucleotidase [Clostridia bacterium]|nr:5'-deoxynucleotidase [Clostridia bacterium]
MNNAFFAFISRMKYINRWGLMHNSRYENLSEHSFETAYIANALASIENTMFGGNYETERITTRALFHDSAEIITGDMPTPVKYKSDTMADAYALSESSAKETLLRGLTPELKETYRGYLSFDDRDDAEIIKAADKLSALIKCTEEINIGNRDFKSAEKTIRDTLSKSGLQSVGYFMENILPCFSLTLDELSELTK